MMKARGQPPALKPSAPSGAAAPKPHAHPLLFARYLSHRRVARHFRRHPWWGHATGIARSTQASAHPTAAAPAAATDTANAASNAAAHEHAAQQVGANLLAAAQAETAALLAQAGTSAEGLSEAEADALRGRFGPNQVETEKPLSWPLQLWLALRNPFSLLLLVLAGVSWLTNDLRSALVILTMVALSTGLRFVQERHSSHAADALKALVSSKAAVMRPGQPPQELPMALLVPGDVVRLSAGDMVPADGRVLTAKDLFINQAAMTGEALPVEKRATARPALQAPAGDLALATGPAAMAAQAAQTTRDARDALAQDNLLFMGTNVVSGSASMVILATGGQTYFGELARHASSAAAPVTQFQAGINSVSWLLIRFMAVMVPLVFFINGFGKGDWLEAFLFALSVAVGLTPEMLPMIVTSTLAKGALVMSRRQVIVKRLDAIQNIGAMDVLCTDKTGTLTQDRIALGRTTDVNGDDSAEVLRWVWLNSHHQTGLKSLMDEAVLAHIELAAEGARWAKVDEVPFDFERRRLSVVVAPAGDAAHPLLICKGAVEEVLACCTQVREPGPTGHIGTVGGPPASADARPAPKDTPITSADQARLRATAERLNAEGLRVVAVAVRSVPAQSAYHVADEAGLTLVGYVAFLDPPKESTAPALAALAKHGVSVKVLTGDNEAVTRKVCANVGLAVSGVLLGPELAALDDAALRAAVETHNVYAKLAPQDKERIVNALRANGHVVGFMGDGINDAPALHAADVGISVDSGADIAKEVADIILLEKSLLVLVEGVVEGRKTFANMLKYIKMTASSNFGNVLSVLVASVALPFLPMLPMHLLVQNLLYDFSQVPIPFDAVDEELLVKPQRWNPAELGRFMLCFGPLSSIFDLATFALMWFVFDANSVANQTLFQSGWFVEGLLTQTLVVHLIRTPRIPFLQSRAAPALLATTGALVLFTLWLPMGPLAPWLKLQPLPSAYFLSLPGLLLGYMALVQGMKGWWKQRHGWQ